MEVRERSCFSPFQSYLQAYFLQIQKDFWPYIGLFYIDKEITVIVIIYLGYVSDQKYLLAKSNSSQ